MSQREFNDLLTSLDALSPEQLATLRRELDGKLATAAAAQTAGSDLGSIGAMREDADFLDEIVERAMKARREQPWRSPPVNKALLDTDIYLPFIAQRLLTNHSL
jgi:hypothetical protein